ncbi:hypothetical protein GXM_04581 [Nostoc sphaeroides CCNUC1]|uniref:Uncharacterized protein n=1 Tax=Nostoc sphaeroides CCNUC1 TaxID=2653204 RepID=A0A5P8W385_9NOSO|nr:hypothetical protein GXM_04581 [Nostoc sphaeroides CCNUC1]
MRYVFKAINLGEQDLGVPQLLGKRYIHSVQLSELCFNLAYAKLSLLRFSSN